MQTHPGADSGPAKSEISALADAESNAPQGGRETVSNRDTRPLQVPRPSVLGLVVFAAAVLVFAPSLDGPWLFDDIPLILKNPFVHGFEHWQRWFTHDFWAVTRHGKPDPLTMLYWRPLVLASYALDWELSGGIPAFFHAVNLVLHGICSLLVFALFRRWFGRLLPAFFAALVFAVHPVRTENVAWISGRTDLLLALAVLVVLHGVALRLRGKKMGLALEVSGTIAAYLSKETAIVLPVLVAVEVWIAQDKPRLQDVRWREAIRGVVPHVCLVLAFVAGRHLWLSDYAPARPVLFAERALTVDSTGLALEALGRSVWLTVWPSDLTLGAAVFKMRGGHVVPALGYAVLGGVALMSLLGVAVWARRRRPTVLVALLLSGVLLMPAVLFAHLGSTVSMSPRLLYVPLIPILWLLIELVAPRLLEATRAWRAIVASTAALAILALSVQSTLRSQDFRSAEAFWARELERNPTYGQALMQLVTELLSQGRARAALRSAAYANGHLGGTSERAQRVFLLLPALEAVLWLTPDVDHATLASLRDFARSAYDNRPAEFRHRELGLTLILQPGTHVASIMSMHERARSKLLIIEARAASRIGDAASTRQAMRASLQNWQTGSYSAYHLVSAAVRVKDFDLANEAFEATKAVLNDEHLQALERLLRTAKPAYDAWMEAPPEYRPLAAMQFYALTASWGLAYDHARPLIASEAPLPPEAEIALGDLAYRAGDEQQARRLLSRHFSAPAVDERLHELSLELRRRDAPAPPRHPATDRAE